jgi:hypothetical protein
MSRFGGAGAMAAVLVALVVGLVAAQFPVTVPRGNPSAISDAAEIPTTGESTMLLGPAPLGRAGRALQAAVVLACPAWCLLMPFLERARSRRRGRQREPVETGLRTRWVGRELGDPGRSLPR